MDEKVVELIADKLGIAADQVSAHIGELWPMYVQATSAKVIGCEIVAISVLLISAVMLFVSFNKWTSSDEDDGWLVCFMVAGIVCFVAAITTTLGLADAISYVANPEGAAMVNILDQMRA